MPLSLPRLDDRTWEDLIEESRLRIPLYAPKWTNHNASDPGITLIELFAYYCESFLYRLDQVGDPSKRAFLKLIRGPEWQPCENVGEEIRKTLQDLRRPHRAVTAEDFEFIALAVNERLKADVPAKVGRAKCLPRTDLGKTGSRTGSLNAPGHVSVVIVPHPVEGEINELLQTVRNAIESARLIGTRVHIAPARYVALGVRISIVAKQDELPNRVKAAALQTLSKSFDPLTGGPNGEGWPFGRSVYVSEIYQLLARVPGIKSLEKATHSETGKPLEELVLRSPDPARVRYNRLGELEAIELKPWELVIFAPQDDEITVTRDGRTAAAKKREVLQ